MKCDGCGYDLHPLTRICPNCGIDYRVVNQGPYDFEM